MIYINSFHATIHLHKYYIHLTILQVVLRPHCCGHSDCKAAGAEAQGVFSTGQTVRIYFPGVSELVTVQDLDSCATCSRSTSYDGFDDCCMYDNDTPDIHDE